jgi:hypothetical protein
MHVKDEVKPEAFYPVSTDEMQAKISCWFGGKNDDKKPCINPCPADLEDENEYDEYDE